MAGKGKAIPNATRTATDAEHTAPEEVRTVRQVMLTAKAAALKAKGVVKQPDMGRQADRRKNAFGIAASASKATAVSRSIVSRGRGGRGR